MSNRSRNAGWALLALILLTGGLWPVIAFAMGWRKAGKRPIPRKRRTVIVVN